VLSGTASVISLNGKTVGFDSPRAKLPKSNVQHKFNPIAGYKDAGAGFQ